MLKLNYLKKMVRQNVYHTSMVTLKSSAKLSDTRPMTPHPRPMKSDIQINRGSSTLICLFYQGSKVTPSYLLTQP